LPGTPALKATSIRPNRSKARLCRSAHRFGVADVDLREFDVPFLHRLDFVLEARALSGAEAGREQVRSRLGESIGGGAPDPGCSPNQKELLPEKS
jgi:hypothetical protein